MSKGLVPPLGTLPSDFVSDRVNAWAVGALAGPAHAAAALSGGASLVVGASDPAFGRQVTDALTAAGFDAGSTRDIVGVELAGCAKNVAALAAAAASPAGPNAAGAAAGKVFAEIDALARHEGSAPETFAGLAGAGDLVATVMADGSRNRRAGEMLAAGHARRGHRLRARPDRRGRRVRPAARRARAGGRRRRPRAARAGRRHRGRGRGGELDGVADGAATGAQAPTEGPRGVASHAWPRHRRTSTAAKARLDADFSALYKAHLRDVYSYSYYRVGNHHDAEDLTEQTFLQAYRHFERAQRESQGRPLRPWLIRIAHNLAANYYRDRSRKPQTPIDDASTISATHTTEGLVEDRDDLKRILECVQDLPDDRREALIMRFALGMDNREIARALGRTDGATKVLLHRAIKQLEELVQKAEGPTGCDMNERTFDIETMLRQALAPVEPPAELELRLESTLGSLIEMAADELETWELSTLGDPKNWVRLGRPAAAAVVGSAAAVGLVVLRTQRQRHRRRAHSANVAELAVRTLRDGGREARRLLDDLR